METSKHGRCGPLLAAALALCGSACTGSEPERAIPVPPRPAELDPRTGERVEQALAALRAAPSDAERWIVLGLTYEGNDLFGLAVEAYRGAIALAPSARVWHRLACAEAGRGDWTAAAEAMERSIALEPGYGPSHWRLGTYRYDLGDFEGALTAYREAQRLEPNHLGGSLGVARVHLQAGEPAQAIALLERLRAAKGEEPNVLRLLASAYQQAGRTAEAARIDVARLKKGSLGRDPWLKEFREYRERPLMEKALEALQGGDPGRAIALLEEFVAEKPGEQNALAYLASAYALVGRAEDARRVVEEALAREPDNLLVLRVRAKIEDDAGNWKDALATLAKIVEIDPNDIDSWRKKGRIEALAARREDALESLRTVYTLDRRAPEILVEIGGLELALGHAAEAVESFEEARRAGVRDTALVLGLARAYSGVGRASEGIELLERTEGLGRAGTVLLDELRGATSDELHAAEPRTEPEDG